MLSSGMHSPFPIRLVHSSPAIAQNSGAQQTTASESIELVDQLIIRDHAVIKLLFKEYQAATDKDQKLNKLYALIYVSEGMCHRFGACMIGLHIIVGSSTCLSFSSCPLSRASGAGRSQREGGDHRVPVHRQEQEHPRRRGSRQAVQRGA